MHVVAFAMACALGIAAGFVVEWQYGSDQPLIVDCLPQVVVAATAGYLVNGRLHTRTAAWVWIIPLVSALLLGTRLPLAGWWGAFVSQDCGPTHCAYEIFGTGPLLASIGYAIAGHIRYADAEPVD
jgi:hypothetical protein